MCVFFFVLGDGLACFVFVPGYGAVCYAASSVYSKKIGLLLKTVPGRMFHVFTRQKFCSFLDW